MSLLVVVRHGQSQWNLENRFTGTVDQPLTDLGKHEAREAGTLLKSEHFDTGFTSVLQRSIETMDIILRETGQIDLPIERSAALNERMYGDLQGMNKAEAAKRFGEERVYRWRRGYADRPPGGESLADTYARVVPYFNDYILSHLQAGENVLIVAHGNSLRALMMELEHIGPEDIEKKEIATGVPRQYSFEKGEFTLLPK